MTTRPVRGVEIAEVDESAVASYLAATPEFFDRHAQLLSKIRLPDARGGGTTVSLSGSDALAIFGRCSKATTA